MRILVVLAAVLVWPLAVHAVTIDTVLVGHPGNAADIHPDGLFGRVTYTYRIATTPVTNVQYAEFLNAVAASDPYGLYNISMGSFGEGGSHQGGIVRSGSTGSYTYSVKPDALVEPEEGPSYTYTYADKPVVFVSWFDAIRFANWMHNGQGSGDTETGAYTLLGGTSIPSNANSITRNPGATWFLASESEWYKAAYYDGDIGDYFVYPTSSDDAPNNNLPSNDTGNSANFRIGFQTTTGEPAFPHTDVGAYTLSASPYGTFDQGGNVWEWNESLISANVRGRRGGAWDETVDRLASSFRGSAAHGFENGSIGFRLATLADLGLPGDFNNDGTVDAADYVLWRKTSGTPAQYDDWRANFGISNGSGATMSVADASVPEPASVALCAIGLLSLVIRRPSRTFCIQRLAPRHAA